MMVRLSLKEPIQLSQYKLKCSGTIRYIVIVKYLDESLMFTFEWIVFLWDMELSVNDVKFTPQEFAELIAAMNVTINGKSDIFWALGQGGTV